MKSAGEVVVRPGQVKAALWLWAGAAALNLLTWGYQARWHDWVTYPTFAVLVGLAALLVYFIYRGWNWARWLAAGLVTFRLLMMIGSIQGAEKLSIYETASLASRVGFQLAAVILLFSAASRKWFGAQRGVTSQCTE
ncbi:MAG TPA: hypothetical protein VJA21_00685 [Verrucomicrobiae bacterium]